jgi:dethiobiotin synthetase
MNEIFFVTGIGTGIGKTITSAVLTEKLHADYWKPIQSGDLDISDSLLVKNLISNARSIIHPEAYRLGQPLSPHLSARLDGIQITINQIEAPRTDNTLIIEGAGGLMVPLNNSELIIDLIRSLGAKVIVVSQNYLGSINHTLLTLEVLKSKNLEIEGLIFNGTANAESEDYISSYSNVKVLGKIPNLSVIDKTNIQKAGIYLNF